jgi:tRNA (guanine-N7-)-methyltransferase
MVWHTEALYPGVYVDANKSVTTPTVLDIGCGFGGLTLALASLLPNDVILGMEIRAKVTEYVRLRIVAARKKGFDSKPTVSSAPPTAATTVSVARPADSTSNDSGKETSSTTVLPSKHHDYINCAVMRTNSMKFLPHYFERGSIRFFWFPDPHFKRKNHARRIVATRVLAEYTMPVACLAL